MWQRMTGRPAVNIFLMSVISIVQALAVLILLSLIFNWFPAHSGLEHTLMPEWQGQVKPERDMFFYRIFVFTAIVFQAGLLLALRGRTDDPALTRALGKFLLPDLALTGLVLFALFKIVLYQSPPAAQYLLAAVLAVSLLWKILWFKADAVARRIRQIAGHERVVTIAARAADLLVPLLIFTLLYIPDARGVVAGVFNGDLFQHIDGFVMSTGWAFLKGSRIYVDVGSTYGMGLPIGIGMLAKATGGFSYENVVRILMVLTCLYFVLMYAFLRVWLRNVLLAAAGILLMIKFQMFNYEPGQFIWGFPSLTAVRFFLDVVLMFFVLRHIMTGRRTFFFCAAATAGAALFYVLDTGLYQLAAFYAYFILCLIIPCCRDLVYRERKDIVPIVLGPVTPVAVYFIMVFASSGMAVFTKGFWANATELVRNFSGSYGAILFYDNLLQGRYLDFFMSCLIPAVYLLAFLAVTTLLFLKKTGRENLMVVFLSLYGLDLYHFHVCRSASRTFYTVVIPFLMILLYGAHRWIASFRPPARTPARLLVLAVSVFALFTTHTFLRYPNMINPGRVSFEAPKLNMEKNFISQVDVALIGRNTAPDQKVCLISSFETALLIAADRRPFFYYFRLVQSRFFNMRDCGRFTLSTKHRFRKMMDELKNERPPIVIIERKLFFREIPQVYYQRLPSLSIIVSYLQEHYVAVDFGKYLVALKRKDLTPP